LGFDKAAGAFRAFRANRWDLMHSSATLPARVSFRLVLASIVGVWVTYFVIATLRGWVIDLEMSDALLWRRVLVIVASMAVTLVLWPLLRLLDFRSFWVKGVAVLLIALPASLALAGINYWAFASIEEQVTTRIGAREGLSVRSDEAGNLLIDPLPAACLGGALLRAGQCRAGPRCRTPRRGVPPRRQGRRAAQSALPG
jgi:hypothetical protein